MLDWKARYRSWEGTAAELANVVADVLQELDIVDDEVSPNERLVRHYAQQGVLERPERRGKEALFGFRQIVEFLVARSLLRDGWPLAKVAEFNRCADLDQLLDVMPQRREHNRAQELVSKFRQRAARSEPLRRILDPSPSSTFLARSAEMTKGRITKREALDALGTLGEPPRQDNLVRLELAPWCHVYFDPEALRQLPPDTPERLGQALTHLLIDERIRPGDKK